MADVRERAARAMAAKLSKQQLGSHIPWHDAEFRQNALEVADAAIAAFTLADHIAAVEAAGYLASKPHDWGEDPDPLRRSMEYPHVAMQCRRCGRRNTDLGGGGSCDAGK